MIIVQLTVMWWCFFSQTIQLHATRGKNNKHRKLLSTNKYKTHAFNVNKLLINNKREENEPENFEQVVRWEISRLDIYYFMYPPIYRAVRGGSGSRVAK